MTQGACWLLLLESLLVDELVHRGGLRDLNGGDHVKLEAEDFGAAEAHDEALRGKRKRKVSASLPKLEGSAP